MEIEQQDSILRVNTSFFTLNAANVLKQMTGVAFTVDPDPDSREDFTPAFIAMSHFSGSIQGDYLFMMLESTASRIAAVYPEDGSADKIIAARDSYAGLMTEALNTTVHQSIGELEKHFGRLKVLPPAWVFGEFHMADYVSGIGRISGECGAVQCRLSLNLATLSDI